MSEEQELELNEIVNGPSYEKFIMWSNIFNRDNKASSVSFQTSTCQKEIKVYVLGLSRDIKAEENGNYSFTGRCWTGWNWRYIIGSYNPTKRKGFFYCVPISQIEQNPFLKLMCGVTIVFRD
ncbi:hypothetical protein H7X65_00340 [Candidatus Parcubacteria bacterium]|nr:hypothetical protein [Candidatus Parcubacteria bacterium]